jgi:hypothetical protein
MPQQPATPPAAKYRLDILDDGSCVVFNLDDPTQNPTDTLPNMAAALDLVESWINTDSSAGNTADTSNAQPNQMF